MVLESKLKVRSPLKSSVSLWYKRTYHIGFYNCETCIKSDYMVYYKSWLEDINCVTCETGRTKMPRTFMICHFYTQSSKEFSDCIQLIHWIELAYNLTYLGLLQFIRNKIVHLYIIMWDNLVHLYVIMWDNLMHFICQNVG